MSDKIFIEDPKILFDPNRVLEFFPSKIMSLSEKTNSLVRLSVYTGVAVSLYNGSPSGIQNALIAVIVIMVLWKYKNIETLIDTIDTTRQLLGSINVNLNNNGIYDDGPIPTLGAVPETRVFAENAPCRAPTKENPFMNRTASDPMGSELRACRGEGIDKLSEELLNSQMKHDPTDIFGRSQSQRAFYTVPEEDRDKFAKLLFKDAPNCKVNPEDCVEEMDLRREHHLVDLDPELL